MLNITNFLLKLYEIVDEKATSNTVDWFEPDGDGFIIRNFELFTD
jgi:hypothetical protein